MKGNRPKDSSARWLLTRSSDHWLSPPRMRFSGVASSLSGTGRFHQVHDQRFAAKYGSWRLVVEHSVTAFPKCGDLHDDFARVRCPHCKHEMFVAFSSKQRCTCPSCHKKRALLTAIHGAEDVGFPGAHWFTIPKRLRVHTRFDRKLLGKLCSCPWACIHAEIGRALGGEDVQPGMIAAVQTFGELVHWHPTSTSWSPGEG